ncbi:MAG: hypothetical protein LBI18_02160, partial [Planctomycetaceae bacterium]|nr:hypothetical protein [Planctomycetaceae bacterium]
MTRFIVVFLIVCLLSATFICGQENAVFKAGASCIDITPQKFPVIVNGGFFPQIVETVQDPLYARCLMLQNDKEQIVFVVVDSCYIPLPIAEEMKRRIHEKTGIPQNRLMISATHCHSAPSLGRIHASEPDNDYITFLPDKIVETVIVAQRNLVPAKIGWAVGNDPNNVYCRRFLMKKGTAQTNPFGGTKNDRAQMNPGVNNPNKIARTGPVDTAVSIISVLSKENKPLALFANYSTHYAGVKSGVLSGDYFGVFAEQVKQKIAEKIGNNTASNTTFNQMSDQFVGMMSNGTSGDANCIDFLNPNRKFDYQSVGRETAEAAMAVWSNIEYFDYVPLAMTEKRITLSNRLPTSEEIQAAKDHLATLPEGKLKTIADIYARNTTLMVDHPKTSEIPIQAMRIGELGVTALPGEIYGITGLEIKARSPFQPTINIGLANGYFGYIPPPEQHALGGYNTWRNQTTCLEVDAETKIKNTVIELLKAL